MASFDDVEKAGDAVADIIAAGIVPAGLEMMDRPATRAVEQFVGAGYDLEAAAILLCEADGTPREVEHEIAHMEAVLKRAGATRMTVSRDEAERLRLVGTQSGLSGSRAYRPTTTAWTAPSRASAWAKC